MMVLIGQFNRLSIIDLSTKANQPMISDKTNSVLMFNGKIYNSKTLRNSSLKDLYDFKIPLLIQKHFWRP